MDEDEQRRRDAARRDALLREMERKSLDTIMVYNPTDKDYMIEWDKRYHRVPSRNRDMGFGKGKMELSRYLAEKYAREMKNYLINMDAVEFMQQFREKRQKAGQPFRDKFEENTDAIPLVPKTNDADRIKEIYSRIILGVVREYGMDTPEELPGEPVDSRTPEEAVLAALDRPYTTDLELTDDSEDMPPPPKEKQYKPNKKDTPAAEVSR